MRIVAMLTFIGLLACFLPLAASSDEWANYVNCSYVNCLVFSDGSLWSGTDAGLVCWDPETGLHSTITSAQGLLDNDVRCLAAAPDGSLWIGTPSGACRFDGESWTALTEEDGLPENDVSAIGVAEDGTVWIAVHKSGHSLCRLDGSGLRIYTEEDGLATTIVSALAIAPDGTLWIGGFIAPLEDSMGAASFNGTTFTNYDVSPHADPGRGIHYIAVDPFGPVWFVPESAGVLKFENDEWSKHYPGSDSSIWFHGVSVDVDGSVWLGCGSGWEGQAGVHRFDGTDWTRYTTEDDLCNDEVNCTLVGPLGNKWFGTRDGISRFDGTTHWKTFSVPKTLLSNGILCLCISGGRLLYGTGRGAGLFDGQFWSTVLGGVSTPQGLKVNDIVIAPNGDMWFGTDQGARRFNGVSWEIFYEDLVDMRVKSLAADIDGSVWFGGSGGVTHFDGATWTQYTEAFTDDRVNCITIDHDAVKWFGTSFSGVATLQGDIWNWFDQTVVGDGAVTSIAIDSQNVKWIGTTDGLARFDGTDWTRFTENDGLVSNSCKSVAIAEDGIWVVTSDGASKFDGETFTNYTMSDGLVSNEIRDIAIGWDDSVWFGTSCGISRFKEELVMGPGVTILTDRPAYTIWQKESVLIAYNNPLVDINVDLVVALQFPDGSLAFYPAEGIPLYSGVLPGQSQMQPIEFLNILLVPGFPTGRYCWYAALFAQGTSDLLGEISAAEWWLTKAGTTTATGPARRPAA